MDIAAHSTALISIIIGIGLTEMFGNLLQLVRHRSRVVWDWLSIAWAATILIILFNYWWSFFLAASGSRQANSAAELGLMLVSPILLFLATASVLPKFDSDSEWDMRRHYGAQRKVFILTLALYVGWSWVTAFLAGSIGWDLASIIRAALLALLLLMLVLNSRRLDWVGVLAIAALLVVRLTAQALR